MFRQSLVLVVILCLSRSFANKKFARIQGGIQANKVNFPWIASIRFEGEHFCGGSIINRKTILTAAHCVFELEAQEIDVRVDSKHRSTGGQLLAVDSITHHGKFDEKTMDYDIAILRLSGTIVFTSTAYAVPLATTRTKILVDDYGYIVGWGHTSMNSHTQPEVLQYLIVQIFSDKSCEDLLGIRLSERMVCAGDPDPGKSACYGDSGGPLTIDDVLVGIASYGPECDEPGKPDVYTKVAALRPWVEGYLQQFEEQIE